MTSSQFRKSSYSASGNCVEVAFRKSGHSGAANCVEVGNGQGGCGMVHVRDSKNPGAGILTFTPAAWAKFLEQLR